MSIRVDAGPIRACAEKASASTSSSIKSRRSTSKEMSTNVTTENTAIVAPVALRTRSYQSTARGWCA